MKGRMIYRLIAIMVLLSALVLSALFGGCNKKHKVIVQANQAPVVPSKPSPANGATGQGVSVQLSWECSDPDADSLMYDIYLGTSSNPPLADSDLVVATYNPDPLAFATTYHWKVLAQDDRGLETEGPMCSFSTAQDTSAPAVTVISPNGGEIWDIGTSQTIIWQAEDDDTVVAHRLEYSTDAGTSWTKIKWWTQGNPEFHSWSVPVTHSTQCLVKASCRDGAGNVGTDISDSNFTIRDNVAPEVTVIYPNGGERFFYSHTYSITWDADDNIEITHHEVEYSTDAGTSWTEIEKWTEGNPETYSWKVPSTIEYSTRCRVKVSCRDEAYNVNYDISDSNFTISGLLGSDHLYNSSGR